MRMPGFSRSRSWTGTRTVTPSKRTSACLRGGGGGTGAAARRSWRKMSTGEVTATASAARVSTTRARSGAMKPNWR